MDHDVLLDDAFAGEDYVAGAEDAGAAADFIAGLGFDVFASYGGLWRHGSLQGVNPKTVG